MNSNCFYIYIYIYLHAWGASATGILSVIVFSGFSCDFPWHWGLHTNTICTCFLFLCKIPWQRPLEKLPECIKAYQKMPLGTQAPNGYGKIYVYIYIYVYIGFKYIYIYKYLMIHSRLFTFHTGFLFKALRHPVAFRLGTPSN